MNNKPVIVAIIAARLDSRRLPGKALREVDGQPLIDYVLARAGRIPGTAKTIVATTTRAVDDRLAAYLEARGHRVFRGETDDVAKRLLDCAIAHQADYFIRVNGDSVFVDPQLIGDGVAHCQQGRPDLVTNLPGRTFPYGVAVEIIRTAAFAEIYPQMAGAEDREHVTAYLYAHPEQ